MPADVDHHDVGEPHGEGEEDLGVAEVRRADGGLGDERADEQAGGHAGKAEEERLEGDLVGGFERREPGEGGRLLFEAALLNQVQERGDEREQEGGVGGEEESNVEEYPAGGEQKEGRALLTRMKGGHESEKEADGEDEDAKRHGLISRVNKQECYGEEEAKEGLGFVGVDGKAMVGGVEHLGQGDEVEEDGGSSGGDGDVTPAWAGVEGGGQNRKRGYAVEEDRDSEPEEGHRQGLSAINSRISSISGMERRWRPTARGSRYAMQRNLKGAEVILRARRKR